MVVKWGKNFHRSVSKVTTQYCVALPPICAKIYPGHQSVQNVTPYCVSFDTNLCKILPNLTTMFPPLHCILKSVCVYIKVAQSAHQKEYYNMR